MYMSEEDFDSIATYFVSFIVGIGLIAGLVIGIPCGVVVCAVSYSVYRCCKVNTDADISNVDNSTNIEVSIELANEIEKNVTSTVETTNTIDFNEVSIIGGEVFDEVSLT